MLAEVVNRQNEEKRKRGIQTSELWKTRKKENISEARFSEKVSQNIFSEMMLQWIFKPSTQTEEFSFQTRRKVHIYYNKAFVKRIFILWKFGFLRIIMNHKSLRFTLQPSFRCSVKSCRRKWIKQLQRRSNMQNISKTSNVYANGTNIDMISCGRKICIFGIMDEKLSIISLLSVFPSHTHTVSHL